ncbi:MAG: EutN/CcmL family microcompartment protein [Deltaproteobacteria bacterium]
MRLCRVIGPVVSTVKHEAFAGRALLSVQPIDERAQDTGRSFLAIDRVQAGPGDRVLVLSEGSGVRQILGAKAPPPIRSLIVGIVDAVSLE